MRFDQFLKSNQTKVQINIVRKKSRSTDFSDENMLTLFLQIHKIEFLGVEGLEAHRPFGPFETRRRMGVD